MKHLINGLLFILFVYFQLPGNAQLPIRFTTDSADKYIGKKIFIFEDTFGKYSFKEVRQHSDAFIKLDRDVPNLGTSNFNHWLRFSIINTSRLDKLILNLSNPSIDSVTLYSLYDNGAIDSIALNGDLPADTRIYEHQFFLFPLHIPSGDTITCFLRLKSDKQVIVPVTLNTERSIIPVITVSDLLSGLYFGIMFAMILYNLFIYFSIRDPHYLSYVHYLFWVTATQSVLLGYLHRFFLPENRWAVRHILIFSAAMAGITTVLFTKSFLYLKKYAPRFNRLLNLIVLLDLAAIVLLIIDRPLWAYQLVNITAGIGSLIVIAAAILAYRKKYLPAKYFLIGWSFFMASVMIFVLKDFAIINYNFWTVHSLQIGSAAEAVLLSFALANKLNILKKEKEAYQHEALIIANENKQIIQQQNTLLQSKVNERTQALRLANDGLNKTLNELKQTQSQLVESEKMASLGQLTAGIAHEINNPINFVTSNVSPLKRDINILFEVMDYMENLLVSEIPSDKKKLELDHYKEEQETDYLRIEITHLINGINNGAQRTAEIVKGLRIFSRLDEDSLKYASVNEGIDSAMIILNNKLGKIKIIRQYGELPQIECYAGKLNQVFLNILSNAIYAVHKHFGNNSGGEIVIQTIFVNDNVKIIFKDNGTGMDDVTQKKVFDPFFTTKEVGEGTGLGMSIAYTTVKKHGGTISIYSLPGNGSEFTVMLPRHHNIL